MLFLVILNLKGFLIFKKYEYGDKKVSFYLYENCLYDGCMCVFKFVYEF